MEKLVNDISMKWKKAMTKIKYFEGNKRILLKILQLYIITVSILPDYELTLEQHALNALIGL